MHFSKFCSEFLFLWSWYTCFFGDGLHTNRAFLGHEAQGVMTHKHSNYDIPHKCLNIVVSNWILTSCQLGYCNSVMRVTIHNSPATRAIMFPLWGLTQCVPQFCVSKQRQGCWCLRFLTVCAHVNARNCTGGGGGGGGYIHQKRVCTERWLGEKSLAASGSQTGVSSTAEWCWAKWAASLPCAWKQFPRELGAVCDVRCRSVSGGGEESIRECTGPWGCPGTDRDSDATGTAQYRHCQVHPEAFPTQPENVGLREFCCVILVQFPPSPGTQSTPQLEKLGSKHIKDSNERLFIMT